MKVIYVFDILCVWCYGFDDVFSQFVDHHPKVSYELVMGGLFTDDWRKPVSEFAGLKRDAAQVESIYGVSFGKKFYEAIETGSFIMDSAVPDHVFTLLREHLSVEMQMKLAKTMAEKFFVEGKNMNEISVYQQVAEQLGLSQSLQKLVTDHFDERDNRDFDYAKKLNVQHFPTLYLQKDNHLYDLRGSARTYNELELNYQRLLHPLKLARP